jgi:hypothetical protein
VRKIICKVEEPVAQRIHNENSERMLLASFATVLTGDPGTQCRYANPQSMDQALKIAVFSGGREARKISDSFYAKFDRSVRLMSTSPNRNYSDDEKQRPPTDTVRLVVREVSAIELPVVLVRQ